MLRSFVTRQAQQKLRVQNLAKTDQFKYIEEYLGHHVVQGLLHTGQTTFNPVLSVSRQLGESQLRIKKMALSAQVIGTFFKSKQTRRSFLLRRFQNSPRLIKLLKNIQSLVRGHGVRRVYAKDIERIKMVAPTKTKKYLLISKL